MVIDKANLDEFRKDFENLMLSLQEKYDVTIELGRISYRDNSFSARIDVNNGRDSEQIARAAFDENVWKYEYLGFRKGMYNCIVIGNNGVSYVVKGLNTKAKRYPIEVISLKDGKPYRLPTGFIKEVRNEFYIDNMAE